MKTKYIQILLAALLLLVMTACGNNDASKEESSSDTEEITLTDAMGEVTIPSEPKNIIATYLEDSLVSLDVIPAAQWSISGVPNQYLQDKLENVPLIEWNVPLEQVIEADTDLLIFSSASAIPSGQYEEYKKVTSVYVMEDQDSTDWRKQISQLGQILNKEDKSEQVLEEYEENAQKASEEIKGAINEESVAAIWVTGGQYFLMEKGRFAANVLYEDLDLAVPSMIENMDAAAADGTWSPVSLEALSELDADHVFLIASEGEKGIETLNNSTVWQSTPAAQNEHVYEIAYDGSWTVNGKIASDMVIETVKKTVIK
ncbi:MAG: ABC transporter substrate-binding protein [Bacillus sp. (in: firmicutes)]